MFIVRVHSVRHSFHLRPRAMRTDESVVTLKRTDTSSDKEEKTECRTWKTCSRADHRYAQHSQSYSAGRCDVVCGQVVRRVKRRSRQCHRPVDVVLEES